MSESSGHNTGEKNVLLPLKFSELDQSGVPAFSTENNTQFQTLAQMFLKIKEFQYTKITSLFT